MPKKQKKFADDGWAIWVDGDDTSTVYINNWLNPKGKSYVDLAIRIRGVKLSKMLHVYVPFAISVKVYGFSVVVNLAISFPVESLTDKTAPDNGSFVS